MNIIKRDGTSAVFSAKKIMVAIEKATNDRKEEYIPNDQMNLIINDITHAIECLGENTVEQIQDRVESNLKEMGYEKTLEDYKNYRKERTIVREKKSKLMASIKTIGVETDRDNANVGNDFSAKLLRIASESNKWFNLNNMPKWMAKLHENGDLYYHDLDSFNLTTNCVHIDAKKHLRSGFNPGYGFIRQPKRIETAAELICILIQAVSNKQFGGASISNLEDSLDEYVKMTRKEIKKEYSKFAKVVLPETLSELVEEKLVERVRQAMQGICYNLNTMHSRGGGQVPFSGVNVGIVRNDDQALICKLFLEEYDKGLGKGERFIFPNIAFRCKKGINFNPEDKYYYLFELACKVAAGSMNPTFMNMDADFNLQYFEKGIIPATMGCRTYVCSNVNGKEGPESRGNIAPTTINLPRLGILAKGSITKFFELLDKRLEQTKDSLLYRYDVLKNLRGKDLSVVIDQGVYYTGDVEIGLNDSIEPWLKQGTWAIGWTGLAETLIALIGEHHGESEEAYQLGMKIVNHMRDYADKCKNEYQLNFSLYSTPAEGLSGKFVPMDRERFGIIPGVTDKDYYTNSYHIPVYHNISIVDKINKEADFHKLNNGGHISYIELDGYPTGDQINKIITYAYNNTNISYMGINFHIRYCKGCGHRIEEEQKFCPECGSSDIQGISRVTGYLALDERFTPGKTAERADRISHNGDKKHHYTLD